ncbi:MAG: hypothetical protein JW822_09195 [Spirochaetales bacterium]|nr:hypothetical protein [Spirochaetales bacterium]
MCNCIWGKGNLTDYNHFIYKVSKNTDFPVGWKWAWPRANADQVKAYPSISFGRNPWSDRSTIPQLPRRIDQIRELTATYDITHCVTGKYNLSFDLWITETEGKTNPPEANIVREVMIWQDHKGQGTPHNWFVRKVTIDGEVYKFYKSIGMPMAMESQKDYKRDYFAFLK